jgi:excisionase family DNA binding protein
MPERFVDARAAGEFLGLHLATVQRLARSGALPAHPIGDGVKMRWRFLLSELAEWLLSRNHN